jgi:hypothetical protein
MTFARCVLSAGHDELVQLARYTSCSAPRCNIAAWGKLSGMRLRRLGSTSCQLLSAQCHTVLTGSYSAYRMCVVCASAAASESGALRAIKSSAGAAVALEFGAVQTQQAGDAAALRRKFAAVGSSSASGAS